MNEKEFRAEAAETVEALARGVSALDAGLKSGRVPPGLINDVFRAAHSLKGVSGLLGSAQMGSLAHSMEDVLDALRLGKVKLTAEVLGVLEEAVDTFQVLVAREDAPDSALDEHIHQVALRVSSLKPGGAPPPAPSAYPPSLTSTATPVVAGGAQGGTPGLGTVLPKTAKDLDLPADFFSVLTEYEEHRLAENVQQGVPLYLVHAPLPLDAFDAELTKLTDLLKQHGEIITTLPSAEKAPGVIAFDVLFAGSPDLPTMKRVVSDVNRGSAVALVGSRTARMAPAASGAESNQPAPRSDEAESTALAAPRGTAETVRVDIEKLDRLMNVVGEIALVKNSMTRIADVLRAEGRSAPVVELQKLARSLERRVDELQTGIMETRMVPLAQTFERLQRLVKKTSRDLGKDVELVMEGEDTELDKLLMEQLTDPLMHLVRNAVDHGLEDGETRVRAGKPRTGRLLLSARPRGNHVLISVGDDGAGLDEVAIRKTALERGLVTDDRVGSLSSHDLWNLIFLPGFSTRRQASDISGRGVGMDVVKTNITRLSGVIEIDSVAGRGTRFDLTVPITLAIIQSLIIRIRRRTFALPLAGVSEILSFDAHKVRTVEGREVFQTRKGTVALLRLGEAFGFSGGDNPRGYVVLVGVGVNRVAVVVDELVGRQDIVIKPLGRLLKGLRGIAGATDLGERSTVLVLDVGGLVEEALGHRVAA